jgi:ABC-type histidine transport system ATPase subunit
MDAASASDGVALKVVGLRKTFGDVEVLRGVSFELRRGEVLSVIGASGSGKSTLLRCLNLLEQPGGGEIWFGDDLVGPRGTEAIARRRTGMVFQQFNLWPHMTVRGNVMEGLRQVLGLRRDAAAKRAERYLDQVGMRTFADRYPARLSGGQQQRVAIARALAMEPEVMLFDEATSALDPELTGEVLAVIRGLAQDGTTMIVVTHEMAFAREVSDRIMFLHEGIVEEEGPPGQLLADPASPRLRRFLTGFGGHG